MAGVLRIRAFQNAPDFIVLLAEKIEINVVKDIFLVFCNDEMAKIKFDKIGDILILKYHLLAR